MNQEIVVSYFKDTQKCVTCSKSFNLLKSIGQRQCSYHKLKGFQFLNGKSVYYCCPDIDINDKWAKGCVPCDHTTLDVTTDSHQKVPLFIFTQNHIDIKKIPEDFVSEGNTVYINEETEDIDEFRSYCLVKIQ